MKTRQLDRRPLAYWNRFLIRWFWCAMLWGAIGVAAMADQLPLLPG
ncbi:hypothetical protein [Massilia sp. DD77]